MEQKKKRFTQGLKRCTCCDRSTVMGNFCSECGDLLGVNSVELAIVTCHLCGEEVPDRHYCINCGADLFHRLDKLSVEFEDR